MYRNDVLTPDHPRWADFIDELRRAHVCNRTTENARDVMAFMGEIDVEASLEALRLLGGRCDCEIVFELGRPAQRAHA